MIGKFNAYKNVIGTIELGDPNDGKTPFRGRLINVSSFIDYYYGDSLEELYDEFRQAVDEYLDLCASEYNNDLHRVLPIDDTLIENNKGFTVMTTDNAPTHVIKPGKIVDATSVTGNEYQDLAMRTNDGKSNERLLLTLSLENMIDTGNNLDVGSVIQACLGLSGEVGEFNDMIKKWIFHEKPLDVDHLKKECGDIMWYIALMCYACKWNLDEIMQINIDKLKARYPEGFDVERANNRKEGDV